VSTTAPAVPGGDTPDAAEQARAGVPGAPTMAAAPVAAPELAAVASESAPGNDAVTVTTDVLQVLLDGGEVLQADLLRYPSTAEEGSAPVRLFSRDPADFFVAQSGWISNTNATPTHLSGFVLDRSAAPAGADFKLAPGQDEVVVPFVWTGPDGVSIHRTYTFRRGIYVVDVRDQVVNQGATPWQGFLYRQLSRVPRALESSAPMSPEKYSFQGAAWFSAADKYEKRKYADFIDDGPLDKQVTGGWIAFLQHHFFGAWIPAAGDTGTFSLSTTSPTIDQPQLPSRPCSHCNTQNSQPARAAIGAKRLKSTARSRPGTSCAWIWLTSFGPTHRRASFCTLAPGATLTPVSTSRIR
jgi:YidC/Oxa1 family membrane protein insertase